MALQTDASNGNARCLKFPDQGNRAFALGRVLQRIVVVIQLRFRVGLVRKLIGPDDVIRANDFFPLRLAQRAVVIECFVHHVPAADFALVPADDGGNVVVHPLQKRVALDRASLVILENPFRRLIVPDQIVADDEHVISQTKLDVTIRRPKIVAVRFGMDGFPFQNIFRADGIELFLDERRLPGVLSGELRFVQSRADEKIVFEGFFQRGLGVYTGGHHEDADWNKEY